MKRTIGFGLAMVVAGFAVAGTFIGDDFLGGAEVPVTEPVPLAGASPFEYPIALWDARVEGETILMVHVTDVGAVDSAYVLSSSGHAAFDSAAVTGSRVLRFEPGRRGEEPIASWARLPVRFRMPADSAGRGDA